MNLNLNQKNKNIILEYLNNNNKYFISLNNNEIDKIIIKYDYKLYFYENLY